MYVLWTIVMMVMSFFTSRIYAVTLTPILQKQIATAKVTADAAPNTITDVFFVIKGKIIPRSNDTDLIMPYDLPQDIYSIIRYHSVANKFSNLSKIYKQEQPHMVLLFFKVKGGHCPVTLTNQSIVYQLGAVPKENLNLFKQIFTSECLGLQLYFTDVDFAGLTLDATENSIQKTFISIKETMGKDKGRWHK